MTDVNWGMLAKSQIDPEKIEEAINRIIADHNNNPDSHLDVGQSLQSHKASAIIDHKAASIVADKMHKFSVDFSNLTGDKFLMMSSFETLDGFAVSGFAGYSSSVKICGTRLTTGLLTTNWFQLLAYPNVNSGTSPDYTKNPILQFRTRVFELATSTYKFFIGDTTLGATSINCTGFKIDAGVLYAMTRGATNNQIFVDITGSLDLTTWHTYRVEVINNTTINFYVDEVLLLTLSSYLTNGSMVCLFNASAINNHDGNPSSMIFESLIYQQDK